MNFTQFISDEDNTTLSPGNDSSASRTNIKSPIFYALFGSIVIFLIVFGIFASRNDASYQEVLVVKKAEQDRMLKERIEKDRITLEQMLEQKNAASISSDPSTAQNHSLDQMNDQNVSCVALNHLIKAGEHCCSNLVEFNGACYSKDNPYISISSPISGASIISGQTVVIQWETIGFEADQVNLYLISLDTSTGGFIARDIPNTGIYEWQGGTYFATPDIIEQTAPGSYRITALSNFKQNSYGSNVPGGMPGTITIIR